MSRPDQVGKPGEIGLHALHLDRDRDAWVYVPAACNPSTPSPLVLSLHRAGGRGVNHLEHLRSLADEAGFILVAPTSRRQTWDVIYGEYGPDIVFIDRGLDRVFHSISVDPEHIAVEGFSDGASYALSLGLANGKLFTHVLAFSPGFMAPATHEGTPEIFISHGTEDAVLRIDACSRRIVPRLTAAGYRVRYEEFRGGHTVPDEVARRAANWFLQTDSRIE